MKTLRNAQRTGLAILSLVATAACSGEVHNRSRGVPIGVDGGGAPGVVDSGQSGARPGPGVAPAMGGRTTHEGVGGGGAQPVGESGGAQPVGESGGAQPVGESGGAQPVGESGGAQPVGESGGAQPVGTGGSFSVDAPRFPSELLDLSNWKITLPVAADDNASKPLEIKQPELATYSIEPHFHLNPARNGVIFRAHAGGTTTSNSGYPRSELREMANAGTSNASWSTSSGTHTLLVREAFMHLPEVKPHAVGAQIHDANDDIIMVRLEGARLFVEGGGAELGLLNSNYVLGTAFDVKLEASGGEIRVFYEDMSTPKVTLQKNASGCYFKAGVYTQSNVARGDLPEAYGEVVIYGLSLLHQ
ncbi:MAG: polysaccharide lyase family 7 protein [Polyangiaceae bacterium]|nr:polysaccharide lyase family 7 protein [Polyangiaceae bacterium]